MIEGCFEKMQVAVTGVCRRERMDDITRISRMSDCGTVTKRAAALQKWKLKLDRED